MKTVAGEKGKFFLLYLFIFFFVNGYTSSSKIHFPLDI